MRYIIALLLFSSVTVASVPLAPRAGADGKIDMFGCMLSNDYYIANFAAYPVNNIQQNKVIVPYCQDLPFTGNTQISIDLLDRDVRRKPAWIKVFDKNKKLIAETSPAVQKQAVLTTRVDFPQQGEYDIVLYVEDSDLNTQPEVSALHIPLKVAMPSVTEPASATSFLKVAVAIALLVFAIGWLVNRQLKPSAES